MGTIKILARIFERSAVSRISDIQSFILWCRENANIDPALSRGHRYDRFSFSFQQAVFETLVDIICDKMSESLDNDPTLMAGGMGQTKGQRLTDQPTNPANANCNC